MWQASVFGGQANSNQFSTARIQDKRHANQMDKPIQNADASTDLYFGPTAPAGDEKNWMRTVPGKSYFLLFRLYLPEQAFFDKTWKPDDVVKVK